MSLYPTLIKRVYKNNNVKLTYFKGSKQEHTKNHILVVTIVKHDTPYNQKYEVSRCYYNIPFHGLDTFADKTSNGHPTAHQKIFYDKKEDAFNKMNEWLSINGEHPMEGLSHSFESGGGLGI